MALRTKRVSSRQGGMTLMELLVAIAVLMVGITGVAMAIPLAIGRNFANRQQSSGTTLAQMTIEKIMAAPVGTTTSTITDCAGTAHTVNVTSTSTNGATLTSSGAADYTKTQGTSGAPAGYYMNFAMCSTQGQTATYDVRWNIQTVGQTKLITVSSKLLTSGTYGMLFSLPVTVRSMIGQGD